jgi:hypothetical protein
MNISNFDDLLAAARQQAQAQRLLLVFATAELPDDATAEQRAEFEQGGGGALVPAMCVDKAASEIIDFASVKRESTQFDTPWQILFASSLSGAGDQAPPDEQIQAALQRMIDAIKLGMFANMLAFDEAGHTVSLGQH